jgi:hypothetical protein
MQELPLALISVWRRIKNFILHSWESSCDVTIAEFNCLECPAHSNFDMRHKSYCVEGSEEEQRNK